MKKNVGLPTLFTFFLKCIQFSMFLTRVSTVRVIPNRDKRQVGAWGSKIKKPLRSVEILKYRAVLMEWKSQLKI